MNTTLTGNELRELRRAWIHALESGAYHQAEGYLCNVKGNQSYHCCLGVLCRVGIRQGLPIKPVKDKYNHDVSFGFRRNPEDPTDILTDDTLLTCELRDLFDIEDEEQTALANMNDDGESFKEIAKYLRNKYGIHD